VRSYAYFAAALLAIAIITALLTGYRRLPSLDRRPRTLFYTALCLVASAGLAAILLAAFRNAANPPEWDFLIFWTNGTVAAHGSNYYDPRLASSLATPFHPTQDFLDEALPHPFLYPPPSILWFVPLGWFSMHTAAFLWFALQVLCLAAAVFLLAKYVLQDDSITGLMITTVLTALLYGTYLNIRTAQTLFLLLLLMTLLFRDRERARGGIWLALGIFVKPLIAVLFVWFLLRRKWSGVLVAVSTMAAAALGTLAIFGTEVFKSYLAIHFDALPPTLFTEPENQSLLAWALRITGGSGPMSGAYIVIALLLTGATVWRIWRIANARDDVAFAVTLVLGLLIYPASLRSYSVLLLIPILILCRDGLIWPVAFAYALMLPGQGYYAFFASGLIWMLLTLGPARPMLFSSRLPPERFELGRVPG
jgi:hypothetical protein